MILELNVDGWEGRYNISKVTRKSLMHTGDVQQDGSSLNKTTVNSIKTFQIISAILYHDKTVGKDTTCTCCFWLITV